MALSTKYGKVTVEHEPGNAFEEDEPVFLIRARDAGAPVHVRNYAEWLKRHAVDPEFIESVVEEAERVRRWQDAHPELVKWPD